jgi:hypothetical protein
MHTTIRGSVLELRMGSGLSVVKELKLSYR